MMTAELITNVTLLRENGFDYNVSAEREHCLNVSLSDDDEDLISSHEEFLLTKFMSAVYVPAIFLLGGSLNFTNIIVFFKHGLRDRVNLCLFSLSLVDFVTVSFYCLIYCEQMFTFQSNDLYGPVRTFLTNNKVMLFYSFQYSSTFLTSVIAVERCLFVLFPLRASLFLSTKTMAIFLAVSVSLIGLLRLMVTARYVIACVFDAYKQVKSNELYVMDYEARNKLMLYIVDGILYGFILSLGCPGVIFIATALTSIKLWQTVVWRKQMSLVVSTKEMAVTKMLILLSVKYLVITLPRTLIRIVPWFYDHFSIQGKYRYFYLASIRIGEGLNYLGISVSFVVYYFAGSKFRLTLHSLSPGKRGVRRKTQSA